jgi:hypothetical protein
MGPKHSVLTWPQLKLRVGRYKSQVECLVIDHLEDYPLVLGNPWLNRHNADISYQRKQVILRRPGPNGSIDPEGQHYVINSCSGKSKEIVEPELFAMGEVLLDSLVTKQTELLTTKQVAKLVKRDQLEDSFFDVDQ